MVHPEGEEVIENPIGGPSADDEPPSYARTDFPHVWDFRFPSEFQDNREVVSSSLVITSSADAFASGAIEPHPRGHAVVDSGATETVGSLPAIEDLLQFRFELHGNADQFRISDVPSRRFRFGNGATGFSLSHLLIPQDLGDVQVELGIYSLDVQNVPILLGIKSLRSLKTVIDFDKDVAVFASLNPYVGIPLRRGASGHVLINLSQNWLQDSFSLADPTPVIGMASQSCKFRCHHREKRADPEPPEDEDMELLPDKNQDAVYHLEDHEAGEGDYMTPAFAVTLDAPATEEEWKAIVKNPKKFIAKSVQKGVEVAYSKLNREQRAAMNDAMQVEVDNWLKTVAVKAAAKHVPRRELLRMRWVLTFKQASPDGEGDQDQKKQSDKIKAKARIVILGYSDPNLLEASTVSPAMSRLSRQLLLNMAAVCKWDILCGDVKSAFLQAKSPQEKRGVFATPVPELSKALNLREGQAVQLLKSCYGLVSAPREWYNDVHKTLLSLGCERLVSDSCVWRLRSSTGQIIGLISSHVDDFLMAGESSHPEWQRFLHAFHQAYDWSPWERGAFKHCGLQLVQHADYAVTLDHSAFCGELKQMPAVKEQRTLNDGEIAQIRAILGSVQWRVYQSAPHHAAKLNYLQSMIASKDSSIVEQVNKLVREVYASRSVSVQVQSLGATQPDQLCLVAWSDASLANRPDLSSTGGYLVGLMNQQSLESGIGKVNPVSWKSGKLHRVARSSLAAESQALADAEQELFNARLEWREMQGDVIDPKDPESTSAKANGYLIVDAKAMYDTLSKGVFVASQRDKYTGLELLALSQRLEAQRTTLLWCDSDHQLADGLTKSSKQDAVKRFLCTGSWRIRYDGAFISAKRRRLMNKEENEDQPELEDSTFLQVLFSQANSNASSRSSGACRRTSPKL
ncbi:RE1 [Symbiodinium sp. CCMP2592]|nr:RE1 [Symbiodinium sp. CCMP2592]